MKVFCSPLWFTSISPRPDKTVLVLISLLNSLFFLDGYEFPVFRESLVLLNYSPKSSVTLVRDFFRILEIPVLL